MSLVVLVYIAFICGFISRSDILGGYRESQDVKVQVQRYRQSKLNKLSIKIMEHIFFFVLKGLTSFFV